MGTGGGDNEFPFRRWCEGHAPNTTTHDAPDGAAHLTPEGKISTVQLVRYPCILSSIQSEILMNDNIDTSDRSDRKQSSLD